MSGDPLLIDPEGLDRVLHGLAEAGYTLVGPVVRDGAVILDRIEGVGDLPVGVGVAEAPGTYRLTSRVDPRRFAWGAPMSSWKRTFLPPRVDLVEVRRTPDGALDVRDPRPPAPKVAAIGVRPCDLAAIRVQDTVLAEGPYVDTDYAARREGAFLLVVNCGVPTGTCFCVSMGTGPAARGGFDLALTELGDGRFVVEIGSAAGRHALAAADPVPATLADVALARAEIDGAVASMGRTLRTEGLPERLDANLEHARWDDVAARCLACANCTLSCPTCFCTTIEDGTNLSGDTATRTRCWDSCFHADFAYVHGGSVRPSVRGRYRQWLTHKLSSWIGQFGTSGCIGCGRCITWCPAGIDLVAEATAVGASGTAEDGHG